MKTSRIFITIFLPNIFLLTEIGLACEPDGLHMKGTSRNHRWLIPALLAIATLGAYQLRARSGAAAAFDQAPLLTVSAASFEDVAVAPEAIVTAFGSQLATQTGAAVDADPDTPGIQLPTELGGVSVEVNDRRAGLFFVSPSQINYLIPAQTESGVARVVVRTGAGAVLTETIQVKAVAPALFTANSDGRGVATGAALRVKPDGAQTIEAISQFNPAIGRFTTRAVSPGVDGERVFLTIYLSGIRRAADPNSDGNLNESVKAIIGGVEVTPSFAGRQSEFAGLDQINVEIPLSLAGRGRVSLAIAAAGVVSNLTEIEIAASGSAPPQVTGFSPATALAGDTLTISGSGFSPTLSENLVRIGGVEARVVIAASTNQLLVEVPFGALSGAVSVRTPEGEGASANSLTVRTSISGFVEDTKRQPIAGVTVRLVNRFITATTDAEGVFILPDVPAGPGIIEVDGTSVPVAGAPYPKVAMRMNVGANRDNPLSRSIALQQVTGASFRTGAAQAGPVTFTLPSNSTTRLPDGTAVENLSLSIVENSRTPAALPAGHFSAVMAAITPFSAILNPGGRLGFPNSEGWPAGTQAKLFRLDQTVGNIFDPGTTSPNLGSFVESGVATVTADGQRVETAANAIREATIYFVSLEQTTTTVNGRVVDSDGVTPVRQALATARGQDAVTDGNGAFTLRNVPARAGDQLTISAAFLRPQGRVDRTERRGVVPIIAGTTQVSPDIALPAETSNRSPVIIAPAGIVANQGESRDFDFIVSDPDSDQTVQAQVVGASFASIKPGVGLNPFRLTLAPGPGDTGQRTLTLTATDSLGASATATLTVIVNRLPVVNEQTATTDEDVTKTITPTGSDADGQSLQFVIVRQPAHGRLSGAGANLTYSPATNYNGADSFTFKASDGFGDSNTATVFIAVRPVNDAPVLTVAPALAGFTGENLIFTLTATDPDLVEGQTLNFTATGLPGGATFAQMTDTTAQFVWTPDDAQAGVYTMRFVVSDDGAPALSDSRNVMITVRGRWRAAAPLEGGWVLTLFSQGATLFAGTQGGGMFVSSDQGQSWTAVKADFASADVHAFAAVGATLLAGSYGSVYRSTNQGQSWIRVSANLPYIRSLVVSGANIWAATDNGVYLSTNGGQSWTALNRGLTNLRIRAIAVSGANLVAGSDGGGAFLSTDQGQNWTAVNLGASNLFIRSFAASGGRLFLGGNGGVFVSTDQGRSWTALNAGLTNRDVYSLAASGDVLLAGTGAGLYRSNDQGQRWTPADMGFPRVWVYSLAISDASLFAGTYGHGVYRSTNQGQNWTAINAGLTAVSIRSIANNNANLFAGTDGGGIYRSPNRGQTWTPVNAGLPLNTSVRSIVNIGANLFAGTWASDGAGGIYLSTNQGQSWRDANSGLTHRDVYSLVVSGTSLFAGTNGRGVYRSTDQSRSWTQVGLNGEWVWTLAASGTTLFAGSVRAGTSVGGVYRSIDGGPSWTAINAGLPPNPSVRSLVVSGASLFAGIDGGVYRSDDQGQNWTAVNSGLTRGDVNVLAVDGASLFAGTGGGVFFSTDRGQSWMPITPGLTNPIVRSLAVSDTRLFAGTLGGGVFVSQF